MIKEEYVPREVIAKQLSVALDDKDKVAVLLDAEDLQLLIIALEPYVHLPAENNGGIALTASKLQEGLLDLEESAFPF